MGVTSDSGRPPLPRPPRAWRLPGRASVAALLAVVVMVLAALAIGRSSLQAAEQNRLSERVRLLPRLAQYTTNIYNPVQLQAPADRTPFPEHNPRTAARLLAQYRTNPTGDKTAMAALVRLDGSVVVSNPAGSIPPTTQLGTAWTDALHGKAAQSAATRYAGQPGWATLAPIGAGRQWGVLIVFQDSASTSAQVFTQDLGSITRSGGGGVASLDADGRALLAWDPQLLGTRLVDPATVTRQPLQRPVASTSGHGANEVTTVTMRGLDGTILIFRQNSAALYADLTTQQRERNLTLLAVLAAAVLALTCASFLRVRAARRSQERLHTLLSNIKDLILVVDHDTTVNLVSPTVQALLGFTGQDWLHTRLLDYVHPEDAEKLARLVAEPNGARPLFDVRLCGQDGRYVWFDIEAGDVSKDPELHGVLLTCHSAGERKALKDKLIQQARHDSLTGLPNRLVLARQLKEALSPAAGRPRVGLLFIDLDRFKNVNDEYGHEAGDQVLCTVAERLSGLVRNHDLVCRFGGDEFGVVLRESSPASALLVAERVVQALAEPIQIGPDGVSRRPHELGVQPDDVGQRTSSRWISVVVGASVGIAMAGSDLDRAEALLRAADGAMYQAKEDGRNRVVMWHSKIGSQVSTPSDALTPPPADGGAPVRDRTVHRPQPDSATNRDWPTSHPDKIDRQPGRESPWPHRGRTFALIGAACLTIIAVIGLTHWQSGQALKAAEHERRSERLALTDRVADYATVRADLQRLIAPVSAAPWALTGSLTDSLVIRTVLTSDLGGDSAQAALRTPTGKLLVASSLGAQPVINTADSNWRAALNGIVGYQPIVRMNGKLYTTYSVPVMRGTRVAAVLVVSQTLLNSESQLDLEIVGSLGFGDGGLSSLDLDGRATYSWNPDLIGTRMVPAAEIDRLPLGRAFVVSSRPGYVTLAATVPTPVRAHRKVIIFQEPTSVFYGDLRSRDGRRDLALFLIVTVAIGLLSWERWRQFRVVQTSEKRLTALLRNAHDIVVVLADGKSTFISSALEGLLGHHPEHWLHQSLDGLVHHDDRSRLARYIAEDVGSGRPAIGTLHDIRLLAADGSYRWFDLLASDLRDHPEVAGIVFTCHEVGERRALQDELSFRSRHDTLTGLPNRAVFSQALEALNRDTEAAGGSRSEDRSRYTVLFIDLDRFKPVNDTFGHDAGDAVLRSVAHRLSKSASESPGSLVCRLGGDEFAVLLPGVDEPTALRLADDILHRVGQPITVRGRIGQAVHVGATIGIAHARVTDSAAAVVKRADEAMYKAKASGRGCYAVS